jgi:hypothetical protein
LRHFTTLLFENKGIWATACVDLTPPLTTMDTS